MRQAVGVLAESLPGRKSYCQAAVYTVLCPSLAHLPRPWVPTSGILCDSLLLCCTPLKLPNSSMMPVSRQDCSGHLNVSRIDLQNSNLGLHCLPHAPGHIRRMFQSHQGDSLGWPAYRQCADMEALGHWFIITFIHYRNPVLAASRTLSVGNGVYTPRNQVTAENIYAMEGMVSILDPCVAVLSVPRLWLCLEVKSCWLTP